jgi:hypothetical protein
MSKITPFPGSVSARNALTSRTATDEQRAAAREQGRKYAPEDLMWAAPGDPVCRRLTDEELATFMPFIARKADRQPRLNPPKPAMATGWLSLRGWEIPASGALLLFAAVGGVWIIDLLVRAVRAL